MKLATFNAAGIRARLGLLQEWIADREPDVLGIQETKVEDGKFPIEAIEELGYQAAFHGQKSWNGVAVLSRRPISGVRTGMGDELFPNDCRIIACEVDGLHILNTYVPNGYMAGSEKFEYKLAWMERFARYVHENYSPSDPVVWMGDINVAPKPEDVYDSKRFYGSVGHNPEEMKRLDEIVSFGFVDLFREHHTEGGAYSFWDFTLPNGFKRNLGWRIDHIYGTEPVAKLCTDCVIDREPRGWEKPSDHTFVVATLAL